MVDYGFSPRMPLRIALAEVDALSCRVCTRRRETNGAWAYMNQLHEKIGSIMLQGWLGTRSPLPQETHQER